MENKIDKDNNQKRKSPTRERKIRIPMTSNGKLEERTPTSLPKINIASRIWNFTPSKINYRCKDKTRFTLHSKKEHGSQKVIPRKYLQDQMITMSSSFLV